MGCADNSLKCVRGDTHLLTMVSEKVLELHLRKIDVVFGV
jgi:hypothetical protein